MRLNTLEKLYDCLAKEGPCVTVPEELAKQALLPIEKMLALS
jgi:quinolinate synthase